MKKQLFTIKNIPITLKIEGFFLFLYFCNSCTFEQNNIAPKISTVNIPHKLCIYYGYPSLINNSKGNLEKASNEFSNFDLIVFGDGLYKETHPDYFNTKYIIQSNQLNKSRKFGYVDIGVNTNNYSLENLKRQIDSWKELGVNGVFLDDAGNDYGVDNNRRNEIFEYVKSNNLNLFINAWNPDDVLNNQLLDKNDIYLMESFLIGHGAYFSNAEWLDKVKKTQEYRSITGIQIAAIATGQDNIFPTQIDDYLFGYFGAVITEMDFYQFTNKNYSAINNEVIHFKNEYENLGKEWQDAETIIDENNLFRRTDGFKIGLDTNGSTYGKGYAIHL